MGWNGEEVTTPEHFYDRLKKELENGHVLYVTKDFGGGGGRNITFSGWETDGMLRLYVPDFGNTKGGMRYISKEDLLAVYKAYEPDYPKKLAQQVKKKCRYRDIRNSVIQQLIKDYG